MKVYVYVLYVYICITYICSMYYKFGANQANNLVHGSFQCFFQVYNGGVETWARDKQKKCLSPELIFDRDIRNELQGNVSKRTIPLRNYR